jgi:hypothetical protein
MITWDFSSSLTISIDKSGHSNDEKVVIKAKNVLWIKAYGHLVEHNSKMLLSPSPKKFKVEGKEGYHQLRREYKFEPQTRPLHLTHFSPQNSNTFMRDRDIMIQLIYS